MIRKRLKKIEQIDSELDSELLDLHASQKQSTHRFQEQIHKLIEKRDEQEQVQYALQQKFKNQIIGSLNKLHLRIDKLEAKIHKQKTATKTTTQNKYHHQRSSSFKEAANKSINRQPLKTRHQMYSNNSLVSFPKRKTNLNIETRSNQPHSNINKIKAFSAVTPKNCDTTKRNSYSSVKVLEEMIEQQLTNLKQTKYKQKIKLEESRSQKRIIESKIKKIGGVIENEKNMESLYNNLEWQTKELVEALNQTRSLCSYQKQKIEIYKSKLKQCKKMHNKENT